MISQKMPFSSPLFKRRGIAISAFVLAVKLMLDPDDVSAVTTSAVLTDDAIHQAVKAWLTNSIDATEKYGPIRTWNTSLVTNMTSLFDLDYYVSSDFNEDLSGWDTARVTTMQYMFYMASSFNGNISSWDSSLVTDMSGMFAGASLFNGNLSSWDISRVTNMYGMFAGAYSFNGNVSPWDTSRVTDMTQLFYEATDFFQTLCWNTSMALMDGMFNRSHGSFYSTPYPMCLHSTEKDLAFTDTTIVDAVMAWLTNSIDATAIYGPIRTWNTSLVTDMSFLFDVDQNEQSSRFNEDLSGWDTSQVTTMRYMFYGASSFNGNLSSWDTSRVTDMKGMFSDAFSFDYSLSSWNTSEVEDMAEMFSFANSFNGDISLWDTSKVTDMMSMFNGAFSFNRDLSMWDTSRVTSMSQMFYGARAFSQALCWDTTNLFANQTDIFLYGSSARLLPFPQCSYTKPPSKRPTFRPTTRPSAMPTFHIWPKPWITHVSPLYGKVTSNLTAIHGTCPEGSKVISITGSSADWVHQLSASCDDKSHFLLGPWGIPLDNLDLKTVSCPEGFKGWNISHGSYIGRMSLACANVFTKPMGFGVGNSETMSLLGNQSIVGLQVYYDSSGIHAMRYEYATFNATGPCSNSMGEPTGNCPTEDDYLAILWGFSTVMGAAGIAGLIVRKILRRRHKKKFRDLDLILPLR